MLTCTREESEVKTVVVGSDAEVGSREKHKSKVVNHSMTSDGGECTSSCGCGETKKKVVASAKKKKVVKSAKKK